MCQLTLQKWSSYLGNAEEKNSCVLAPPGWSHLTLT